MAKKIRKAVASKKQTVSNKPPVFTDLKWWVVYPVFALTTIIFFWDFLAGNAFFWEDFVEFVYPLQTFAARESLESGIPFWNPFSFAGMPFYADLQVGFFYPFYRILSFFVTEDGYLPVWILQFIIIIHYFIAQTSFYRLATQFKISKIGAMIGAVSYSFSLLLVCHAIHPMIVIHLAWFPLVLFFVIKAIDSSSIRYGVFAGLILGMSLLSGHPQTTLYIFTFLGFFIIWKSINLFIGEKSRVGSKVFSIVAGIIPFIIAAGIFAVQLLPSMELAGQSQREESTIEYATHGSLQVKQLYSAIVPHVFGKVEASENPTFYLDFNEDFSYYFYWETAFYFGVAALLLGLIAIFSRHRDNNVRFLIFISIFGLLYAFGSNSFLLYIFNELPFYGTFRIPARMMFCVVLAFSLLAGIGFDELFKKAGEKSNLLYILVLGGILLFMAILVAGGLVLDGLGTPEEIRTEISSSGVSALLYFSAVIAVVILIYLKILKPLAAGMILIIIVFLDLTNAGGSFNKSSLDPMHKFEMSKELKEAFSPDLPGEIFRVKTRDYDAPYLALNRSQGMMDELYLVEGYNPLILKRVSPPIDSVEIIHHLWNIKYELKYNKQQQRFGVLTKEHRWGHARMLYSAKYVGKEKIEEELKNLNFDLNETVLLEDEHGLSMPDSVPKSYKPVLNCTDYQNDSFTYEVETQYNGILCFSEIWYPAWKAYVDGNEVPVLKANYSFRAIPVPMGKHKIVMSYESDKFSTGLLISISTLIVSLVLIIIFRDKKTK